jgi:phage gp29-like protein
MIGTPVILGPNGRPVTADRVRIEKQTRFNPLVNWTPDVLTQQLSAWARGEIRALAWIMQWLEDHDDTISAVAPKAKAAVSRNGFDVILDDEIAPEQKGLAEDQRGVLQEFYSSIEVGHAIDLDTRGGFRLLANQVMDGYGKGWSTHHLVWKPSAKSLGLEAVQVPLWFWEATEGKLRFLESYSSVRGVDREQLGGPSAWMVSRGRGVMLACAIASMFKRIPLQDWLTYCDRHGMPAFLGKTNAAPNSTPWQQLFSAVSNMGSEYGAVVSGSDTIDVLDLTSKGDLPYEKLIDRMDRACVMLWRGGDLSTMSRSNGVGANPQQEESDDLDADNAMWVGETIDRQLSRRVLDWHFGPGTPQLATLKLRTKTRDNVDQDLKILETFHRLGERISRPWATGKFGVVLADGAEEALGENAAPAATPAPTALNTASPEIIEEAVSRALEVRADFLAPLRPTIERISKGAGDADLTDAAFLDLAEQLVIQLPELVSGDSVQDLAKSLEAAMAAAVVDGTRAEIREAKKP